jgi:hypothetical protein
MGTSTSRVLPTSESSFDIDLQVFDARLEDLFKFKVSSSLSLYLFIYAFFSVCLFANLFVLLVFLSLYLSISVSVPFPLLHFFT